jgi:predicted aspartyl protease
LEVEGRKVKFMIDTGADVTVITKEVADALGAKLQPPRRPLFGAGGGALQVEGEADLVLRRDGEEVRARVSVLRGDRKSVV